MSVQVNGIAAIGDVLAGKYRVKKILGIGGMGMVVAATHVELDQRVAIKFMLPGSHESPETSARFLREARAAGQLNSEHVCRVMDVGRFDTGAPYIVMEYLQGEDLAAVLRRRGPLRVAEAVDYILQGIEGLAEAHAHGIIHRDLKPENLFLHKRNDGGTIVKVLDFGISKMAMAAASTRTGDIMGSPAYMAPEQMESSTQVDHRADVWSLGVVLYQLVVGKAPFQGDTLPLLCMHVVNDEPPSMETIRGDLPDGFEAVVMKCLQKEPVDRYSDVGQLARALAPFGPKNATTSASRIQIVLTRTRGSASTISHEFSTLTPPVGYEVPGGPAAGKRDPKHETTFTGTAGQSLGRARAARSSWGLPSAIIAGIALVALAIVVVWRSGRLDADGPAPPAVLGTPVVPAPRTPPPIVEPILEDPPAVPAGSAAEVTPPTPAPDADPGPSTVDPGPSTADRRPSTADRGSNADRKKRRPYRPGRKPPRAGSAAATGSGSGADAGSADEPPDEDDDKWTHMTHDDEKKP
jgi:eukaryotic-like serine/threonine-protein kinase